MLLHWRKELLPLHDDHRAAPRHSRTETKTEAWLEPHLTPFYGVATSLSSGPMLWEAPARTFLSTAVQDLVGRYTRGIIQ
jgi:hypothetical protein